MAPQSKESNVVNELVRRINEDRRRIRLIEQSIDRVEQSLSSVERSVISQMGDLKISLDRINNKLASAAERLSLIESDIVRLNKQTSKSATRIELKQIESFIDLVNPITSKFITKDELERALDERLKRKI